MRWAGVGVLVVVLAACTTPNPRNCADGTCTDPAYPFCDVGGELQGHQSTCIAVSCTPNEFALCRGAQAVICNLQGTDYDVTTCEHGCDPASQSCVGCTDDSTCTMSAPHCDTGTHMCRGCAADNECASELCDKPSGTCADPSTILYVTPTGSDASACAQTAPCSLAHAFAMATSARGFIKMAMGSYTATSILSPSAHVVLSGHGSTLTGSANAQAILAVGGLGYLRVEGLRIVGVPNDTTVVRCESSTASAIGTLDLDHVVIRPGLDGVEYAACNGKITASTFEPSTGVAVRIKGSAAVGGLVSDVTVEASVFDGEINVATASHLHVTNSIFDHANGPGGGGLVLGNGAQADVSFSTFSNSRFICGTVAPVVQTNASNNVMVGLAGADLLPSTQTECAHHYSLITPQATNPPRSDHLLMDVDPHFKNAALGDFHLLAGSPAIDAADPAAPTGTDFDGTARPQGVHSDMGAFELKP